MVTVSFIVRFCLEPFYEETPLVPCDLLAQWHMAGTAGWTLGLPRCVPVCQVVTCPLLVWGRPLPPLAHPCGFLNVNTRRASALCAVIAAGACIAAPSAPRALLPDSAGSQLSSWDAGRVGAFQPLTQCVAQVTAVRPGDGAGPPSRRLVGNRPAPAGVVPRAQRPPGCGGGAGAARSSAAPREDTYLSREAFSHCRTFFMWTRGGLRGVSKGTRNTSQLSSVAEAYVRPV